MLTNERAAELLRYDPDTGKLYWKAKPSKHAHINIGDEAGTLHRNSTNTYRKVQIDNQFYLAHRIVWLLRYGTWPEEQIDHKDGDGLNNRIENLRDVSRQENAKNIRRYRNNASGVTGVYWHNRAEKWYVQIGINGKRKHLGLFADYEDACRARRKAADELGFTVRHGASV